MSANTTSTTFLPKEHGSWSLVLEPLALGLLVAPSIAGGALATTAFAGFLVRRPLKAALAPDFSEHRTASRQTAAVLSALAFAGLLETIALGGWRPLWPLLFVVPLGGLFAWFDIQGEARAAAAELAGSTAFALLPAALATLANWPVLLALALAVLALARSVPTILSVRAYLRLRKGPAMLPIAPLFAAIIACGAVLLLAGEGYVPPLAVAGTILLLVRTAWLVSSLRPTWTARRIGMAEMALGLSYLALITIAYCAPLRW